MRYTNNYTGLAKPDRDGALIAIKAYKDVGMYATCVRVENGKVVALGLGGFSEQIAFSLIPDNEQKTVSVRL